MAQLLVEGTDLVVHLTMREKIAGFHADIRVPLSAIRTTSVPQYPWMALRGWRMAGVALPGKIAVGTRKHGTGFDFTCVRNQQRAVQIDVNSGRFSRFVISVPDDIDAQDEADRIADAAGIARSQPGSGGLV
ncbi:MAG TPA: hypothetical protein VLX59_14600 [Acidimicrobiales bacterium]|nr:hypothetical protein [Acidimicrobiales bacterium]